MPFCNTFLLFNSRLLTAVESGIVKLWNEDTEKKVEFRSFPSLFLRKKGCLDREIWLVIFCCRVRRWLETKSFVCTIADDRGGMTLNVGVRITNDI